MKLAFMLCYCGSNALFEYCCQPLISYKVAAQNAEQLMRSRYSAYAIKNAEYIFKTYASNQQQDNSITDIQAWADACQWIKLTIVAYEIDDPIEQFVEFKAYYIENDNLHVMHEKSRFIQENQAWKYIDGDIIHHQHLKKIARNELCPCQSGKKYKRCCAL